MEQSIGNKLEQLPSSNVDGYVFTPKQDWQEYDLRTYNVSFNGVDTGLQAIDYKGQHVAFRSKHFKVYPHEEIFVTLDPVMSAIKGEPLSETVEIKNSFKMVYGQGKSITAEADFFKTGGRTVIRGAKIRSAFIFKDEKFDVTGNGDVVNFGAEIDNNIGGGSALRISPYSWRQVCKNGAMHLQSAVEISEGIIQQWMLKKDNLASIQGVGQQLEAIMDASKSFDDLAQRLKKERMSHITKIPSEWIASRVYLIKESAALFRQRYREMTEMFVSHEQALEIAKAMPKRLVDKLDWMEVKEQEVDVKTQEGFKKALETVVNLKTVPSQWKAFNDITEDLTHVMRAYDSKTKHYTQLDKILVMSR